MNKIPNLITRKELRDGKRYRHKDIAEGTGLSESMISRLLRDKEIDNLSYSSAKLIARWLGVSTDELGEDMEVLE
jgi:transcriptional regulator with XRE-family HTH domain